MRSSSFSPSSSALSLSFARLSSVSRFAASSVAPSVPASPVARAAARSAFAVLFPSASPWGPAPIRFWRRWSASLARRGVVAGGQVAAVLPCGCWGWFGWRGFSASSVCPSCFLDPDELD